MTSRPRLGHIAFFGHVSGSFGLAHAARNTLAMLTRARGDLEVFDVTPTGESTPVRANPRGRLRRRVRRRPELTFLHLNPPEAMALFAHTPAIARRDSMRAMVLYWELGDLRPDWLDALTCMDVVLTPTAFIDAAVAAAAPDIPRLAFPQAVTTPEAPRPDRARWGLPDHTTAFLFTFDTASDVERKNPGAVVRAFVDAFPGRDDVCLVVKAHGPDAATLRETLIDLEPDLGHDERIRLVIDLLPYDDLLSLCASCDVFVSLHRSEGLGLGLMEAMSLGLPVIATAYSGPLDFLTADNSIPVPYELVPVRSGNPAYAPMNGLSTWAEPDIVAAGEAMRSLADDPARRRELGARARRDMESRRRDVATGSSLSALETLLRSDDVVRHHEERQRAARSLVVSRWARARPGVVRHRVAAWVKRRLRPDAAA